MAWGIFCLCLQASYIRDQLIAPIWDRLKHTHTSADFMFGLRFCHPLQINYALQTHTHTSIDIQSQSTLPSQGCWCCWLRLVFNEAPTLSARLWLASMLAKKNFGNLVSLKTTTYWLNLSNFLCIEPLAESELKRERQPHRHTHHIIGEPCIYWIPPVSWL